MTRTIWSLVLLTTDSKQINTLYSTVSLKYDRWVRVGASSLWRAIATTIQECGIHTFQTHDVITVKINTVLKRSNCELFSLLTQLLP